jgi:hypothetical protein
MNLRQMPGTEEKENAMKRFLLVACGLMGLSLAQALAADAGDPVFPTDLDGKARAEILYQNWNRDLDTGGKLDADVYLIRMHTDVGQFAYLDFDVGGIEVSDSDLAFYGGLGLRYLGYDSEKWRVSPYVQGHYTWASGDDANYDDMFDADGGVLLAYKLTLDPQLTLMPYLGPALSIIRLNGDVDADEKNVFGGVAGLSMQMRGHNSIRIETQYFDQASVSAAAGIAF